MLAAAYKGRNFFWPMVALCAVAIVVLVGALIEFAASADSTAQRREETVVQNGIGSRIDEVARLVVSIAVWDDTVRYLDNRYDAAWAHDNIGQFFSVTEGFEYAYVLNAADAPVYAMHGGEDLKVGPEDELVRAARALVASVRAQEVARLGKTVNTELLLGEAIQASAVKALNGGLYVVTATLVQPDFGTARVRAKRAPIILTAEQIDAPFVAAFADRYMLANAHLDDYAARFAPGEAHVAITDEAGAGLATIDWSPQRPGTMLLTRMLPWTLVLIGLLVCAVIYYYRGARRATDSLIESEARAVHMAFHDPLTGIANRSRLEQRLAFAFSALRRAGNGFAVHCIDLDRFKEVNDVHGHLVGDELLRSVASRLMATCRSADDVCARLGGDEFAIIQFGADEARARDFAQAIIDALTAAPYDLSIGQQSLGCSVGVAVAQHNAADPLEFLRQADLALYRAKAEGRGRLCMFEPAMDAALRARRRLEEDLRTAIANKDIRVMYQPQVNKYSKVVGLEALARWTHPTQGPISPSVFVPLAEESGLVAALGEFMFRRVFEDSARWPNMKVAINVSATQLQTPSFLARLRALVDEMDVAPSNFELELTEGVLLDDDERIRDILRDLRAMGFSLALDDFGTGYSSLSYLRRFPITKIKIDRSFVINLGVDREADEVVSAIVKLARALNLAVIAEGVETGQQWSHLLHAGCGEIQGFIASRPVEADLIADMLMDWTANRDRDASPKDRREIKTEAGLVRIAS